MTKFSGDVFAAGSKSTAFLVFKLHPRAAGNPLFRSNQLKKIIVFNRCFR